MNSYSSTAPSHYWMNLLWLWVLPFVVGATAASLVTYEVLIDGAMKSSIAEAVQACKALDHPPDSTSLPVSEAGSPVLGAGGETR
ncbi:conserved protein of unknown function [Pseudomonas marincola]|uniref:Uncharacterized protein n=1 Tax=Pseudomonas marincola TaxID=437900 RepID=A0A653E5U7_9PSED|nr:conserved protein of unknown function [Pseudomonas marincola]